MTPAPLDPPARSHLEILTAILDPAAFVKRIGTSKVFFEGWRRDGRIPVRKWPDFEAAGAARPGELAQGKTGRTPRPRGRRVNGAEAPPPPVRPLSPTQAHRARKSLLTFARTIDVPGVARRQPADPPLLADHHRLWLRILERVERGDLQRVMCFMPPGSAKSTYAVDVFTPWFLGKQAGRSVLVVTYATDLAARRGRKSRSVARQPAFAQMFATGLDRTRAGAADWALGNGSEWMGAGMLAGITGNRADLIVIDDPVKGRAEADSALIRRRTREEFDDTVRTRLKSGGRIVLIQTRWHEDDLAGSLLPKDYDGASGPVLCTDGEVWEVVNIPAQAERADDPLGRAVGDYLWPEYWTPRHWPQFKVNPRTWNALYQQRPKPEEGSYFQRGGFRRFAEGEQPRELRYYGTSDYAVSEGRGDYTRLAVWGVDRSMHVWRVAAWGGRTSSEVWIEEQAALIERFRARGGVRCWFGEAGVIRNAVEPMLTARLRERRLSCPLQWVASSHDKPTRARAAQSLVQEGRVWVRDDADGDCFIDECVAFPAGRHDDEVDTLSLIGRVLDRLSPPPRRDLPEYAETGPVFE